MAVTRLEGVVCFLHLIPLCHQARSSSQTKGKNNESFFLCDPFLLPVSHDFAPACSLLRSTQFSFFVLMLALFLARLNGAALTVASCVSRVEISGLLFELLHQGLFWVAAAIKKLLRLYITGNHRFSCLE